MSSRDSSGGIDGARTEAEAGSVPELLRSALASTFVLRRKLGRGGMASVYLADDARHPRAVAVKVLHPELADLIGSRRFREEIADLAGFAHPNIVQLIDSGEAAGMLWYAMPFFPDGSLADRLRRERQMAVHDAITIARDVAAALRYAHTRSRPLIHRDVKPQNIMLSEGRALVVDFGIARALQTASREHLTPSGTHPGTPLYMSPEQASGAEIDARTDQYSLACVLYEMLAGTPPFSGDAIELLAYQHRTLEPKPLRLLRPGIPPAIAIALERALAKRPGDRFAHIEEFAAALAEAERGPVRIGASEASAPSRTGAPTNSNGVSIESGATVDPATPEGPSATDIDRARLPRLHSEFVGREKELWECGRLLDTVRILTLVGPGGSGKTRLAIRLAERRAGDYANGVAFVDLAPLSEPERVARTVAAALGVREAADRPVFEAMVSQLAGGRALLVLDNCEHVRESVAALAAALSDAAPGVAILATSREALGVPGEEKYSVPPLALPASGVIPSAESLREVDAVRLFALRARSAQSGFEITDRNAAAVAEICTRLDGIPLAIELAAARLRTLGVDEIRSRLRDRFKLLSSPAPETSQRHRTLAAACQWSYDLLDEIEQRQFRRLSVFAGGWSLEAATAVCGDASDEYSVLDQLTRLADKSLIVIAKSDEAGTRYRLLETLRRFADERLEESGEGREARGRHVAYFTALADRIDREFWTPRQRDSMAQAETEYENFLAAIERARGEPDGMRSARGIASNLYRLWHTRGWMTEGSRVLDRLVGEGPDDAPSRELARALFAAGGLASYQGRRAEARAYYDRSLRVADTIADPDQAARAHMGLGVLATAERDFDRARAHYETSLTRYRATGNQRALMISCTNLGALALNQGDFSGAIAPYDEALRLAADSGDQSVSGTARVGLGLAHLRLGNAGQARAHLHCALELATRLRSPMLAAPGLEALAELALSSDSGEDAAIALAAAQGIRRRHAIHENEQGETTQYTTLRASLTRVLGPDRLERLWSQAQSRTLDEALQHGEAWLARSSHQTG